MEQHKLGDAISRVTAKAWADPAYKAKLMSDPASVLAAEGLHLTGRKVYAHENNAGEFHFVLPPKPADVAEPKPGTTQFHADYCIHEVEI